MIVMSVGQESAPYDIMAYMLVKRLGPLKGMRTYMFQYGNISGGTGYNGQAIVEWIAENGQAAIKLAKDPFSLGGQRQSGRRAIDEDLHRVEQDRLFPSLWLFPFAHSTAQVRMMRRSCGMFEERGEGEYGKDVVFYPVYDAAPKQKPAQLGLASGPGEFDNEGPGEAERNLAQMKEQHKDGQGFLAGGSAIPLGWGSSVAARGMYYSDCYAVAQGESGEWAHVHHTGPDTYEITAICAVAGAMVLVEELAALRPKTRGGVLPPAYAFHGSTWIQRVESHGQAGTEHKPPLFEVFPGRPDDAAVKKVMGERSMKAMKGQAAFAKGEMQQFAPAPLIDEETMAAGEEYEPPPRRGVRAPPSSDSGEE